MSTAYPVGLRIGEVIQFVESSDSLQTTDQGQVVGHTVGSSQGPALAHNYTTAKVLTCIGAHHPLEGHHERCGSPNSRGSSHDLVTDVIWIQDEG